MNELVDGVELAGDIKSVLWHPRVNTSRLRVAVVDRTVKHAGRVIVLLDALLRVRFCRDTSKLEIQCHRCKSHHRRCSSWCPFTACLQALMTPFEDGAILATMSKV